MSSPFTEKQQEAIHQQIRDNFELAFVNLIQKGIEEKDFTHLLKLIEEIRSRLKALTPHESQKAFRDALDTSIDLELLKQELENDAFGPREFAQLITAIAERIKLCQPPSEDEDTNKLIAEIYKEAREHQKYSVIVPMAIMRFNKKIDKIEASIKAFLENPQQVIMKGVNEAKAKGTFYK